MAVKQEKSDDSYIQGAQFKLPKKILDAELEAIRCRLRAVRCRSTAEAKDEADSSTETKELAIENKLVGLALSGGGIRSAIFSLGVMQRLAKEGCLEHVDYLSTVSGGGFIGGSLTWLLSSAAKALNNCIAFGTTSTDFPYGVDDPRQERLREKHSNILKHLRLHGKYLIPGKGITMASLIAVILRGILLNFLVWIPLATAIMVGLKWVPDGFLLLRYLAGIMGLVFVGNSLVYSLRTWLITWKPTSGFKDVAYITRRKFAKCIRVPLWLGLLLFALGSLPWIECALKDYMHHVGYGSLLLGIAGGLSSFASSKQNSPGKIPLSFLAPLASILLLYGLVLASYALSSLYLSYVQYDPFWSKGVLGGFVVLSVVTGFFANLNYISIHKYYRDRLMEAFMPRPGTDGKHTATREANKAKLSEMCNENAPYHLLNTNVVLVDSDDPRWRVRGGDAFLLSPKYCGSSATGWVLTADYMQKDPLTLATAVAVSGAAANPNTAAGDQVLHEILHCPC